MLANIMCWIMVFGLLFSKAIDRNDMYIKLVFALAFILVGAVCKLVDVYREVHKPATNAKEENKANNKEVI